jgi:hypothetical protein
MKADLQLVGTDDHVESGIPWGVFAEPSDEKKL